MSEKKKNTLLENDLKESKKYTKNIMSEITNLLDENNFTYSENESKTEIIVDGCDKKEEISNIINQMNINNRILDILISKDIIDDKVFIRLITN